MLKQINTMLERIERTEDILEKREWKLEKMISPIFLAAVDLNWRPGIRSVNVLKDEVLISYGFRDDSDLYVRIPHYVFEADDPVKAATDWHEETKIQAKAEKKAQRKAELQRELAYLEGDEEDGI